DHSALKSLMKTKEPEGQQARWIETLAEYDFEVKHRPGKRHGNADALSRAPTRKDTKEAVRTASTREAGIELTSLREEQLNDPELKMVSKWLEKEKDLYGVR
ncbi:MAG: hypothetical protein N0E59_17555, partial [Candidatus Thiodiazotropha taylori]|nr:hypothetical protein [Candidatus Thiodiazotropha taylori]MCW4284921.1 hypothetical protein [Candidatus Thiodiazotropha taylori]